MPFAALTSGAGIIIELGPLSSMSIVRIACGSVLLLLFQINSEFLLLRGDGDRERGSFKSIRLADEDESSFAIDMVSLKWSIS